jgi:hypothetical protein
MKVKGEVMYGHDTVDKLSFNPDGGSSKVELRVQESCGGEDGD